MTQESFESIAQANSGFGEVVAALAKHFEEEVPDGFPVDEDWFIERYIVRVNIHTCREYSTPPSPTRWTDGLCFVSWIHLEESLNARIQRANERETDPTAVFKSILRWIPSSHRKSYFLSFQNVFLVERIGHSSYSINIYKYPPMFFHLIVVDDAELLKAVVRNRIQINGVQLELPREAFLGEFID